MQDRVVQPANWCVCCSSWRAAELIFEYVTPCLHCVAPCYQATGAQELLHARGSPLLRCTPHIPQKPTKEDTTERQNVTVYKTPADPYISAAEQRDGRAGPRVHDAGVVGRAVLRRMHAEMLQAERALDDAGVLLQQRALVEGQLHVQHLHRWGPAVLKTMC